MRGFYVLKADGGITQSSGGPAAIGVVLKDPKYRDVEEVSEGIGWARSQHVAEYEALIEGLELARRHRIDRIRVFLDSALVANTVNGDSNLKPKHEHLKDLCTTACVLFEEFADRKICWVPREMNVEADALASKALATVVHEGAPGQEGDLTKINGFLQKRLRRRNEQEVTAVEAARWLDASGILADSEHRPGLPLRNVLRAGSVDGAEQRPNQPHGRWFITRVGS